jgi:methylenetetrahydrofolate dehydrogenase (NADP+) / methenyltetrahydrofolate cyclohydrolase
MKIDGRAIAEEIYEDLQKRVGELEQNGVTPHMAVIVATDDPAITSYINQKKKWSDFIGAKMTLFTCPGNVTQETLLAKVMALNNDPEIHGIIIQQPVPAHIEAPLLINAVSPEKDIDGFQEHSKFDVPIVLAVMKILRNIYMKETERTEETNGEFSNWLRTKKIVVVGKGATAGGPMMAYLKKHNIEPVIIDSKTPNPHEITKSADIIISAVGKPDVLTPDMLKRGVILIGIGMSMNGEGKLKGDYSGEAIETVASFYTPSPGGTGPVNVAMLLDNLVTAATISHKP